MIDVLKKNVETEINILREISIYNSRIESSNSYEVQQIISTIESLKKSMKLINDSIPKILEEVSAYNKLPGKNKNIGLEKISYLGGKSEIDVTLQSKDKEKFLKELRISEGLVRRLKGKKIIDDNNYSDFRAARGYLKLSNKFFLNKSLELVQKGYFRPLSIEVKKANFDILIETYVAMMLFTTLLSFFVGLILMVFFLFFNLGFDLPLITFYTGNMIIRILYVFWIPFVLPVLTFLGLYIYPSTEKGSIARRIDGELPFAVIYMSAISGSGISPSEIFKIIGLSKEYPFLRREIRKVLNQINIYGYDLVTALGNVSKTTPSKKLGELFNGISTDVNSGGDLSDFFEKRAETLLLNYRLEREKFTKIAETFMDIYISVVIATPMILMLLLIMISLTGFETGFSTNVLNLLIIAVIAVINIIFLGFLQIKQPTY